MGDAEQDMLSHIIMCALLIAIGTTATLQMDRLVPKLHLDAPISIGLIHKESQGMSSAGNPSSKQVCDKLRDKFCVNAAEGLKIPLQAVAGKNIYPESTTRKAFEAEVQQFFQEEGALAKALGADDADWDAVTTMKQEDQEEPKFDRRALESNCAQHKEHDAKVQCMVDGFFNSQTGAMHINESDGKIQVIDSVSGKIFFEDTIGDVGQLLEQRVVGMVE